jgi:hypothetical protein
LEAQSQLIEAQAAQIEWLAASLDQPSRGRKHSARGSGQPSRLPVAQRERAGLSRREFARWGALAVAGAAVAAVGVDATPAAAANGTAITVGEQVDTTSGSGDATVLYALGGGEFSDGVLTVTDTPFADFSSDYMLGAVSGYAGNANTALAGVSGYAANDIGAGVQGVNEEGVGVMGVTTDGNGVSGTANGNGAGVYGVASGAGSGVIGSSDSGYGVQAFSDNGTGLHAYTFGTGPAIIGDATDASGPGVQGLASAGPAAVLGAGTSGSPGLSGTSDSGSGVVGTSGTGPSVLGHDSGTGTAIGVEGQITNKKNSSPAVYGTTAGTGAGGKFSAKNAQLQLVPSSLKAPPTTGTMGQFLVDASGNLWYCKVSKGTSAAEWVQLA